MSTASLLPPTNSTKVCLSVHFFQVELNYIITNVKKSVNSSLYQIVAPL